MSTQADGRVEVQRQRDGRWRWTWICGQGDPLVSNESYPDCDEARDAACAAYPDAALIEAEDGREQRQPRHRPGRAAASALLAGFLVGRWSRRP